MFLILTIFPPDHRFIEERLTIIDMKLPLQIRNIVRDYVTGKVSVIWLVLILILSCEKENGNSDYNPPADHTISKDGFMHKSGLNQPLDNCASCHGTDLKGGNTGVSCYECHGEAW